MAGFVITANNMNELRKVAVLLDTLCPIFPLRKQQGSSPDHAIKQCRSVATLHQAVPSQNTCGQWCPLAIPGDGYHIAYSRAKGYPYRRAGGPATKNLKKLKKK